MMFEATDTDTIAAIATAPGRGGIGVIRISGIQLDDFFSGILDFNPQPRQAHFADFCNVDKDVIDQGIALYFPAPHSFTGEHVLELQAHGGPVVLDMLLQRCLELGARLARPGEFTERAFINNKIDLAQAEAIADLIDASSQQAALGAVKSLQGGFSDTIHQLVTQVIQLRIYVEAAIDFPEEEVDFLTDGKIADDLVKIIEQVQETFAQSKQGALMQEGMTVVLAGKPNAGKSSLLNALSGRESAIVTHIPGTTRDVLRESIQLDGMPLHIVDTAGLRESSDAIEQEGIRRAWLEIEQADRILYLVDSTESTDLDDQVVLPEWITAEQREQLLEKEVTVVLNKVDLSGFQQDDRPHHRPVIALSAKTGRGVEVLVDHLKTCMGYTGAGEGLYTARRRHLDALSKTLHHLEDGQDQLINQTSGELLAEDLRMAQNQLSTITGTFTPDDLLGEIFSSFCIGK